MSVLKPLGRGLPPDHPIAQTVGDGLSNFGNGVNGSSPGAADAESAGARVKDDNFNRFPEPIRGLLNRARARGGTQGR